MDIDEYIRQFPDETRNRLNLIREEIRKAAPGAEEMISYGMPGYKLDGKPLIYFSGFSKHIGLYATPSGHAEFEEELSSYKHGKGSVQFPLNKPLPLELISRIIRFRVDEIKNVI